MCFLCFTSIPSFDSSVKKMTASDLAHNQELIVRRNQEDLSELDVVVKRWNHTAKSGVVREEALCKFYSLKILH